MCNLKILLALFYSFKIKSLSHTCFDKSSIYNNSFGYCNCRELISHSRFLVIYMNFTPE